MLTACKLRAYSLQAIYLRAINTMVIMQENIHSSELTSKQTLASLYFPSSVQSDLQSDCFEYKDF